MLRIENARQSCTRKCFNSQIYLVKSSIHLAQRGKTHFWLSDSFQNIKLITVAKRTLLRKSSSGEEDYSKENRKKCNAQNIIKHKIPTAWKSGDKFAASENLHSRNHFFEKLSPSSFLLCAASCNPCAAHEGWLGHMRNIPFSSFYIIYRKWGRKMFTRIPAARATCDLMTRMNTAGGGRQIAVNCATNKFMMSCVPQKFNSAAKQSCRLTCVPNRF